MVWVFSLEWLQLVFGTSLSLVIIALNSHHIYHTLWFFFSQCVQSLMCQENTSLIWNDMNLCGIPHVLVLAAQTQVYQLARSKSKLSLNWGLYTKLVLNCDLQLLPHMGVLTFQLYFFTWPLWTMFSGKFQIQPQKKKYSSVGWSKQSKGSPVTQILHQRNWNWADISWDVCQWGYLVELEDAESPGYQTQRWHNIEKDGEGRARLQPITGFALTAHQQ